MSDLVGNPEYRFSRVAAHLMINILRNMKCSVVVGPCRVVVERRTRPNREEFQPHCRAPLTPGPEVIKLVFKLSSTEYEISTAHKGSNSQN